MNYFEINEDAFIVRNHYFPWKKKEFKMSHILHANRESNYRRSYSLRMFTTDFRSGIFYTGSLWFKTWDALLKDLNTLGIKS